MTPDDDAPRTILRVKRPYDEDAIDVLEVLVPRAKRRKVSLASMFHSLSVDKDINDIPKRVVKFMRVSTVTSELEDSLDESYGEEQSNTSCSKKADDSVVLAGKRSRVEIGKGQAWEGDLNTDFTRKGANIVDVVPKRRRAGLRREEDREKDLLDQPTRPKEDTPYTESTEGPEISLRSSDRSYLYDLYVIDQTETMPAKSKPDCSGLTYNAVVEWADDMPSLFHDDDDDNDDESSIASSDVDAQSVDYPSTPEYDGSDPESDFFGENLDDGEEEGENGDYTSEDEPETLSLDSRSDWRKRLSRLSTTSEDL